MTIEQTKEYIEWVIKTYGPNQEIREGPPGVIYGKASEVLKKFKEKPFHIPG